MNIPTGLSGAISALSNHLDGHEVIEHVTTLLWLRILTDPAAPLIGGHDPRKILDPPLGWDETQAFGALELDVLCGRLNHVMGEELLSAAWDKLPADTIARTLKEVGRWQIPAGDPLGVAYTFLISRSKAQAIGSFFTPYEVSLMMAMMTAPKPGESVCDPCCGSGGMLLAALESVRRDHGPDAMLALYATDIDPAAVRLCRLNFALAGVAPHGRAYPLDALTDAPPAVAAALANARQEWEAGQLPLF